jgi:hypothetical protein
VSSGQNDGMTKDVCCRLVVWTPLAAYAAYLFGIASAAHLITNHLLSAVTADYVWYSLTSAAMAVACWIALGDGSVVARLLAGIWGLVAVWIIWQSSIYVYAVFQAGNLGSTSEGFTVYATGNAVIALVVTCALVAIARATVGLRLARDPQLGPLIPASRHFTLAELLWIVAIFATTLGTARLVAPRDLSYFAWFTATEIWGFAWGWGCMAIVAIPGALVLVYWRKPLWALGYFLLAVTAIVVHQRWGFVGRMRLSSWRFYWLLEAFRVFQVVAHVAALSLVLKWQDYRLVWRWSLERKERQSQSDRGATPVPQSPSEV